jgi:DNA polymerase III subunit gamma/tau
MAPVSPKAGTRTSPAATNETAAPATVSPVQGTPVNAATSPALPPQGARLLVDTAVKTAGSTSLGSLSKIRQQFSSRQQSSGVEARPLEPATLAKAWAAYAQQLRENKNPAVQSLELAELRLIDTQTFTAVTANNLEQRFIESEKRTLSEFLQKEFANRAVSFTVIVEERAGSEEPVERPMNTREQFLQIVGQYPLVKELKDRLKLELDY